MKSTLKPYHNKLKALFAQHIQSNVEDSQPEVEPTVEPPADCLTLPCRLWRPAPHYSDKKAFAEYVAKQNGYVGFEVTASVSPKKIENNHFVYILVPNWSELCLMRVKNQEEWPAGSRPDCQYAQANSDGTLVFDTKQRGPRWKRKGAR
jgi:hypothetical protein